MRANLATIGLLLSSFATSCSDDAATGSARPNLVLITVDTLRADRLGCYGRTTAHTPAIDRLAREGRSWETVIASAPVTLSATATLMTGLDPTDHGARYNGFYELGDGVETLAETLAARGYLTGAVIGNFALDARFGIAQGFATYDDRMTRRMEPDAAGEKGPAPDEDDPDWWRLHVATQYAQRFADEVTNAGIAWLEAADDEPLFLWLHYMDPHRPYDPPERFAGVGSAYEGEVAFVDEQIGRFLEAWDARLSDADSLVALTADHGESLGEHGQYGHVFGVYEPMLRVPLILRRTGVIAAGMRDERPLRGRDVRATILAALDPEPRFDEGALPEDWFAYAETFQQVIAKKGGPVVTVSDGAWKLIVSDAGRELYRIEVDPDELTELANERLDKVTELLGVLESVGPGAATVRGTVGEEELERLRAMGYIE